MPLATSGTFTFTLTGNMTIKGQTHEVTFDVTAKREGVVLADYLVLPVEQGLVEAHTAVGVAGRQFEPARTSRHHDRVRVHLGDHPDNLSVRSG